MPPIACALSARDWTLGQIKNVALEIERSNDGSLIVFRATAV